MANPATMLEQERTRSAMLRAELADLRARVAPYSARLALLYSLIRALSQDVIESIAKSLGPERMAAFLLAVGWPDDAPEHIAAQVRYLLGLERDELDPAELRRALAHIASEGGELSAGMRVVLLGEGEGDESRDLLELLAKRENVDARLEELKRESDAAVRAAEARVRALEQDYAERGVTATGARVRELEHQLAELTRREQEHVRRNHELEQRLRTSGQTPEGGA